MEQKRLNVLEATPATRSARAVEGAATTLLWVSAAVTALILVSIVGYIIYRGLVAVNPREYPVTPLGSTEIPLDGIEGETISIVANQRLPIHDLTSEDVRGLFDGETDTWSVLTGQDVDVKVFLPETAMEKDASARRTLLGKTSGWSSDARKCVDAGSVLEAVAHTPGGIGWVPTDSLGGKAASLGGKAAGVKVVPVRTLSLVVHPGVLALQNGRRLSFIRESSLSALLAGHITSWKELGGPDLPVRMISLAEGSASELRDRVGGIPGSAALAPYFTASSTPAVSILPVERQEVRRNLTLSYVTHEPKRAGRSGGISTIILNTLVMIALTLLFSTPVGVGAAIYLTEYARQGRLIRVLRFGTETLAGIPSILFGLFGFIVFVTYLRLGIGLLSGTLTITMMVLPTIIRTTEEAIRAVPVSLREGSLSLGATRWQTTTRIVVRAAGPGIMTGVILALGRAAGETAALLFTLGTDYRLVEGFSSSARVLAVHLFFLVKEGLSTDRGFAAATILVLVILAVNFAASRLIRRITFITSEETGNAQGSQAEIGKAFPVLREDARAFRRLDGNPPA